MEFPGDVLRGIPDGLPQAPGRGPGPPGLGPWVISGSWRPGPPGGTPSRFPRGPSPAPGPLLAWRLGSPSPRRGGRPPFRDAARGEAFPVHTPLGVWGLSTSTGWGPGGMSEQHEDRSSWRTRSKARRWAFW